LNTTKNLVLQLAKAPIPGRVKTRLIPAIDRDTACELHWAMTQTIAKKFSDKQHGWDYQLHVDQISHDSVIALEESYHLCIRPQIDGDLGQRLSSAALTAFNDYQHVVMIGSDCLELTVQHIESMIEALKHVDVVLLAALDGGYAAIAQRAYLPALFQSITWGSDSVLEETAAQCVQAGISYKVLDSKVRDIDTYEDLVACSVYPEIAAVL